MSVVSTVEKIVSPVVKDEGLCLWDIEFKKEGPDYYLRVFIDKDGGVGISDCENVSRKIDVLLDEADPIPHSYILEVSSAGLVRELKKDSHFEKFLGSEVEVRLFKAVSDSKKFVGELKGYTADTVTVGENTFDRKNVSKIIIDLV